jgi:PAS domain S-box-containing protein
MLQTNFFAIILIIATLANFFLLRQVWVIRNKPVGFYFIGLIISILVWDIGYFFESITTTLNLKVYSNIFAYFGITTLPVFFLFFASSFTNLERFLKKKNICFFFIIPLLTIVIAFTNNFHHLLWQKIELVNTGFAGIHDSYSHGLWYFVHISYCYSLMLIGISMLIYSIFRSKIIYSLQLKILLLTAILPFLINIIYSFKPKLLDGLDLTPVFFTLTAIILTFAVSYYKLFNIASLAWDPIINNMEQGVIIFDNQDRVISANNSIEKLAGNTIKIGDLKKDAFKGYPEINILYDDFNKIKKQEITFLRDNVRQYHELLFSPIYNQKNRNIVGHLILIQDITIQKPYEDLLLATRQLSTIIDSLPDATFAIDCDGVVVAWNKSMENLSGIKKEYILGKGDYAYSLPHYEKPHPTLIDLAINKNLKLIDRYKSIEFHDDQIWAELDISINYQHISLWCIASPYYDSEGNQVGAVEVIRDITDRKKADKDLKASFKKTEKVLEETIKTLSTIVEIRDPYTSGHQQKVAQIAVLIAKEMGLEEGRINAIRTAATIHDIGKISIAASILSKPGKISELEYQMINTHPDTGYNMLKNIDFAWPIANIVLQHHERINGSGYPKGLKGDDILLEARIIAVADTVEAMASHRPYRPSLGIEVALKEIKENKAILYDSSVVDACIKVIEKKLVEF